MCFKLETSNIKYSTFLLHVKKCSTSFSKKINYISISYFYAGSTQNVHQILLKKLVYSEAEKYANMVPVWRELLYRLHRKHLDCPHS